MKVLTATRQCQGQRASDFNWCVEGELVTGPTAICDRDIEDPDGGCGCGRSWSGLSSGRSTTTAAVRDVDMSRDDVLKAVQESLERRGWLPQFASAIDLDETVTDLLDLAAGHPVDAVLEYRAGDVQRRTLLNQ